MEKEQEDLRIGYTKEIKTQYGEIINIGLTPEHIAKMKRFYSDSGYVNIQILRSKAGSLYTVIKDPNEVKQAKPVYPKNVAYQPSREIQTDDDISMDEIPFNQSLSTL